ncbi:RND superfamily efflux pump MFP component [Thalassotalea insulae]|uniref:RND superfamily efflux pump MFP component n=1 Tax=Thalassotalea insulae TaxID=2056778 RepID=A0ABQ6GP30_9GAMM|nr:efflux RND transporter periplasmic adaptor subunit [Thalassotalea insulae]GLX77758.1 RND superfamily efflux pump MFP component [Thalassotalea insulae]
MANKQSSAKVQPRMVPLRYVLTPIAIVFLAIVILMIVSAVAPKPAKKPIEIKAPLVEIMPLVKEAVTFHIESQGSVSPRTETTLISQVSGNVVNVSDKFKVGGFFKQGEVLLEIDDINYQVALVQAESRLGTAQASLVEEQARVEQAKEEWLLSGKSLADAPLVALRQPQLQKAQAELKAAQANLQQAKVTLNRTKIVAPYDAMLRAKYVDIGQFVSTGSQIAMTFAVDYAEVRLPVKQRDILFLDLPKINQEKSFGSAVELTLVIGNEQFHWSSKISRYEGVVDSQSRVHYVVAQIDNPYALLGATRQSELRIGTFVNAKITGQTVENVIAIPRSAISGANTIYLLDSDNKLHIQTIDVLRSDSEYLYTQDELNPDYQLVKTKLETPIDGMTLRTLASESTNVQTGES